MPHPLRSLRNRLTLIFALIVAGAIGIVYFYVTPRLEEELVTQKLERLAAEAQSDVKPLSDIVGDPRVEGSQLQRATERVATGASADVTLLQVSKNDLPRFSRVAVSTPGGVATRHGRAGRPGDPHGQGGDRRRSRPTSDGRRSPPSRWCATSGSVASPSSPTRSPTWRRTSS